jgi:hypothetical protein
MKTDGSPGDRKELVDGCAELDSLCADSRNPDAHVLDEPVGTSLSVHHQPLYLVLLSDEGQTREGCDHLSDAAIRWRSLFCFYYPCL